MTTIPGYRLFKRMRYALMIGLMLENLVGLSSSERLKIGNLSDTLMMNKTNFNMSSREMNTESLARDIFVNLRKIIYWSILGIGIFGVIGNILIILVYTRLGFSETIHASYMALAASDLLCVLSVNWIAICNTPLINLLLDRLSIVTDLSPFTQLTGARPHLVFSKTTALITAWISTERCLCVVFPMKVKLIITRTVNTVVLVMIFIIGWGPVMNSYIAVRYELREDPLKNQTRLFFFASGNDHSLHISAYFLYYVAFPVFSWVVVIVNATVLIIKLKQSANWRKQHLNFPTTSATQSTTSMRTNRVTKTVVIVASIFIVCSLPIFFAFFTWTYLPKFYQKTKFRDLFLLNASLVFLSNEVNSSVNIIVFTVTGARFRSALLHTMCRK
ncbi:peptide receptor gpcr [Plakobranchus ocellatus]|uniref:Peptide receptor gpcr n=1 Tax=Plakobranchus ocellatus TaxID=259542 RepID=A0AAV4C3Y1_9GAST|nr:peptide receptor gpcr [Plakobranchus ocellatus]